MPRMFIKAETQVTTTPKRSRSSAARACRSLVAIVAVVVAVAASTIAPREANAYTTTDAFLSCTEMMGFRFELPASGSARQSQFYFRVDGGQWQTTYWYYTDPSSWYVYLSSGWQLLAMGGGFLPIYGFSDSAYHLVEGWEYRYQYGRYTWRDLGSCNASSYQWGSGGIVFR